MRTNIELNEELLAAAQKYSKTTTKRALVEEALETYIAVKEEEHRKRTYKDRLEAVRSRLRNAKLRSDTREIVRQDRNSR